MDRELVESSAIRSIGYDHDTQILEVEFTQSNKIYNYFNVDSKVYNFLMHGADSKGGFLRNVIEKTHRYSER